MLLKPSARGRGRQPSGPVIVNRASQLSVGLTRWWQPSLLAGWRTDYGSDQAVASEQGTPLLRGNAVGGVGAYCTGGAGIKITALGITASSSFAWRLVCTPITWPANFTAWIDDVGRTMDTFISTAGTVDFDGTYWNGLLPSLTPGKRWDIVLTADANILAGQPNVYVNGVNLGAGIGAAFNVDFYLGYNVSGGGVNADCIYESFQAWKRPLRDEDVWALYDPATRWDLYWVPSSRVFFDVGSVATVAPFPPWSQSINTLVRM